MLSFFCVIGGKSSRHKGLSTIDKNIFTIGNFIFSIGKKEKHRR